MEAKGAIFRLAVAIVISICLSLLAFGTIKLSGTDLKEVKQRNKPKVFIIAGIFNLLFIVAVELLLKIWDHQSLSRLGFSFSSADLLFILIAFCTSIGFALLFVWFLDQRKVITITRVHGLFRHTNGLAGTHLGFVVLFVAALQEEILFRGYFAYVLLPFGFYYALLVSSFFFTAWHFLTNKVNVFQAIDWFIGGVMLFYVFWLSGSIWVAALIHFSRNFTNVLVFDLTGTNSILSLKKPLPGRYKTVYTIIYSVGIIAFGFFYFS